MILVYFLFYCISAHKICPKDEVQLQKGNCTKPETICPNVGNDVECQSQLYCRNDRSCVGICLNESNICDGIPQCRYGEDETQCIVYCPEGCRCQNETMLYTCNTSSLPFIPRDIYALDLSTYPISMTDFDDSWFFLIYLNISHSNITDLTIFQRSNNYTILRILDLSHNAILEISTLLLPSLEELFLGGNPIHNINLGLNLRKLSLYNTLVRDISWQKNKFLKTVMSLDMSNSELHTISQNESTSFKKHRYSQMLFWNLSRNFLRDIDGIFSKYDKLTRLDLSWNLITKLSIRSFAGLASLKYLSLRGNSISKIGKYDLMGVGTAQELDLGENIISEIEGGAFDRFPILSILHLDQNHLTQIQDKLLINVKYLYYLSVANNKLTRFSIELLQSLTNLRHLNLSTNQIVISEDHVFRHQMGLKTLDMRNNPLSVFRELFRGLPSLQRLYVDSFTLCCARPVHLSHSHCISKQRTIPSCSELINIGILKVFIWYAAVLCFVANGRALVYRIRKEKLKSSVYDMFVVQLIIADLLVGFYLLIIGTFDRYSSLHYAHMDFDWRHSAMCTLSGLLITLSNVTSGLFICAITLDAVVPQSMINRPRIAVTVSVVIWVVSFVTAVLPVFNSFHSVYSTNGFCIPFPMTTHMVTDSHWEYSVGLVVVLKMVLYLLICVCHTVMYVAANRLPNEDGHPDEITQRTTSLQTAGVIGSYTLSWIPATILGTVVLPSIENHLHLVKLK